MRSCCRAALKAHTGNSVVYSNVSHLMLPARESVEVIKIRPDPDDALVRAFDSARDDLTARACYCSVLGECWETDFGPGRPRAVKECKAPAGAKLW